MAARSAEVSQRFKLHGSESCLTTLISARFHVTIPIQGQRYPTNEVNNLKDATASHIPTPHIQAERFSAPNTRKKGIPFWQTLHLPGRLRYHQVLVHLVHWAREWL